MSLWQKSVLLPLGNTAITPDSQIFAGQVAEWLNALVSKTSMGASPSGVRIPLCPPLKGICV